MEYLKKTFEKFKALSRTKQIVVVIIILAILGALVGDEKKSSYRSNESSYENSRSTSQRLTCDECGTSFLKSNGVQLSGHSEVFCSSLCATRWGFNHGISVQ